MFKRLKYLFTAGKALDILIAQEQERIDMQKREDNRYRLNLCHKHRQEPKRSGYSEHNCDYCKLLKQLEE